MDTDFWSHCRFNFTDSGLFYTLVHQLEIACISSLLSVIICYSYSHHNTYISLQDLALKKKGIFFIMFKCQPGYTLRKIKGINYLLPYGQQIADLKKRLCAE